MRFKIPKLPSNRLDSIKSFLDDLEIQELEKMINYLVEFKKDEQYEGDSPLKDWSNYKFYSIAYHYLPFNGNWQRLIEAAENANVTHRGLCRLINFRLTHRNRYL